MAQAYLAAGFDFCSVSDHQDVTADPGVPGILWIVGTEENVYWPDSQLSHIVQSNIVAIDAGDPQGAIDNAPYAHLAHPYQSEAAPFAYFTLAQMLSLTGYAAIEINNPLVPYEWDNLLSAGRQIHGISQDDSHSTDGVGVRPWVHVFAGSLTIDNIIAAMNAGQFYSSGGPALTITEDGSSLKIETPDAADITFIGGCGRWLQQGLNVLESTYTYTGSEGYVRAVVKRRSDSKYAWTNAVFL
jgi:hypothetical protein